MNERVRNASCPGLLFQPGGRKQVVLLDLRREPVSRFAFLKIDRNGDAIRFGIGQTRGAIKRGVIHRSHRNDSVGRLILPELADLSDSPAGKQIVEHERKVDQTFQVEHLLLLELPVEMIYAGANDAMEL